MYFFYVYIIYYFLKFVKLRGQLGLFYYKIDYMRYRAPFPRTSILLLFNIFLGLCFSILLSRNIRILSCNYYFLVAVSSCSEV